MSKLKIRNGSTWEEIPAGGVGVPSGGTAGQVLMKSSATDYADEWADISEAGAMSAWELLWTNASPTSAFAAQTIAIPTTYDFYMILCDPTPGYNEPSSYFFPNGKGAFMSWSSGYSRVPSSRDAQWAASGIQFLDAFSNGAANNSVCIPTAIYGIKGVQ